MIATLQAICYHLVELLTPPEIMQIRFITRECVSKILLPTRDKDGLPHFRPRCGSIIRFFLTIFEMKHKKNYVHFTV